MDTPQSNHLDHNHVIEVAGLDLIFHAASVRDSTPTGNQIARAAGFAPADGATVLLLRQDGELQDIQPDDSVDLACDGRRFLVVVSDRLYRLTIDGTRFDWPSSVISGGQLRKLGNIGPEKDVIYERTDTADRVLSDQDLTSLEGLGIEAFKTRLQTWLLNVQGVRLELHLPEITVREAMLKAGFDINQRWHIFLKLVSQPKEEVTLQTVIDLRRPGIEKLRLTPRDVSNGEAPTVSRMAFSLLQIDEDYLERSFKLWETIVDGGRRWLVIHDFSMPAGYTVSQATVALEIPTNYPAAQIDMFYVHPILCLATGSSIGATEVRVTIEDREFQRWSRHRGVGAPWRADTDNVITHLALVESALAKEVLQ
ncbi:multiubiquitin domain-containing protein [Caballeronia sp. GACF4]|uniref:multiubiquitin domain-containing protein n=1 Tax=Caballeronia sp. GACF4 TaxID=2921763 RepID=UPI002029787D|nr:multiubiquitin domain-containing protein [Caballeronia sp. GACF4]